MKQFEAGDKFLQLVQENPKDFTVTRDTGRDHDHYVIRNVYRSVSVCLNVCGDIVIAQPGSNGQVLNYVRPEVAKKLLAWAEDKIEEDKIQAKVDRDNTAINLLLDYYTQK